MSKYEIGTNAGIVWRLLSDQKKRTLSDIIAETGLDEASIHAAIGWLARENKIEIDRHDNCPHYFIRFECYI